MKIISKYSSVCKNCRRPIAVGDTIEWSRNTGAICSDNSCPTQSERLNGANQYNRGCDGTCEAACYGGCNC